MRNIEPARGWAIAIKFCNQSGSFIYPGSFRIYRKHAQDAAERMYNRTHTWKQLYRQGHRAVRVTITVDQDWLEKKRRS